MMRKRVDWWMTSSAAIGAVPAEATAEPQPAADQRRALDHRHPQGEPGPEPEEAGEGERRHQQAEHDEEPAEPEAGQHVAAHEQGWPEGTELARRHAADQQRPDEAEADQHGDAPA